MFPQPLQSVKMGDGAAWGWKFSSDLQVSFTSPSGEILAWLLTKRGCNYIVYHCWNSSMSQRWCHDPDNTLFYVSPTDNCDKSHDRVVKVNDGSINSIENNNGSYCTPRSFPYSKLSVWSKCFCTLRYYRSILIFYFFLHLDGTSHESAEPSRGDVNSAGCLQTVGPLLASALVLLASLSSL